MAVEIEKSEKQELIPSSRDRKSKKQDLTPSSRDRKSKKQDLTPSSAAHYQGLFSDRFEKKKEEPPRFDPLWKDEEVMIRGLDIYDRVANL